MIRVSDKLKEERKKQGLSLDEVAKATKIRVNFLEAIEKGEYQKLPGTSYAHGFVKNYLEFLELPVQEYLARFRREYDEKRERKLIPEGLMGKENISLHRFSLTQAIWGGGIILLAICAYLLFQYRAAIWAPSLTITAPKENASISQQTVSVTGVTDQNVTVTVNALPAYVDNNGNFSKDVPVFPGKVTIIVKAVDSFEKITTIERHIIVTPE